MGMRRTFALAAAVAVLGSGAANAATSIDVDNLRDWGGAGYHGFSASSFRHPSVTEEMAAIQTWTVGTSGLLSQIDIYGSTSSMWSPDEELYYWNDQDFLVTLTVLGGGTALAPGTVELGAISRRALDMGSTKSVSSFDLSSLGIRAAQGDVLTFKMSVERCPEVLVCARDWISWIRTAGDSTSGYGGGSMFISVGSKTYAEGYAYDLNFRTWMSAVPEPSTWAMMIAGFGLTGAALRRRITVRAAA